MDGLLTAENLKVLTEAGAIGVTIVVVVMLLLVIRGFQSRMCQKDGMIERLVTNHDEHLLSAIDRNTEAFTETSKSLQRLTDKIDSITNKGERGERGERGDRGDKGDRGMDAEK